MINLSEEVRSDFLVTRERKKLWNVQLVMLTELLRVCDKYNIKVFAVCGTLLGAIRHKGFIPWDDDMDVGLLRKDYEKLIKISQDEFKHPYFLQTTLNEKSYYSNVARLRNSNTTGIVHRDKNILCNNGIYIDVFPFDGLIENKIRRKVHFFEIGIYSRILTTTRMGKRLNNKSLLYYFSKFICEVVGYDNLFQKYQKTCSRYSNIDTKRVAILSGSRKHKEFYFYKEDILKTILWDYEDIKVPVPYGYDRCLKINYGNYLEYPSIEERGKWHEGQIIYDPDTPYDEFQKRNAWI